MCRMPVARVTTAATMGATYPQGSQASDFPFLAKFGSMCHSHGLEEAPVVHQPGPGHLVNVGQPHHWQFPVH